MIVAILRPFIITKQLVQHLTHDIINYSFTSFKQFLD
jgi:hypothetical protein